MRPYVLQLTPATTGNPYYTDIVGELRRRRWAVELSPDLDLARERARQHATNLVVHVHQLEPFYAHPDRSESVAQLERFEAFLDDLDQHGAALVHTMHNSRRHDGEDLDLDDRIVRSVTRRAAAVIVLGERARAVAESRCPASRVHVVPHTNYRGRYGGIADRAAARADLAIPPDDIVFLMLGGLRRYKQHTRAIRAFSAAAIDTGRLMIVGGRPPDVEYVRELEVAAEEGPRGRVRLVAGVVEDRDMATWLGAADASVHVYDEILVSGSVLLALSYGVRVVASRVGCISEMVIDGYTGRLWDPGDDRSLAGAMRWIAATAPPAREDVAATVAHLSVSDAADRLASVYVAARTLGGRHHHG